MKMQQKYCNESSGHMGHSVSATLASEGLICSKSFVDQPAAAPQIMSPPQMMHNMSSKVKTSHAQEIKRML